MRLSRIPFRWIVVALLFLIAAVNGLDRLTLSILAPTLEAKVGFSASDYSYVVTAFLVAYTLGYLFSGPLLDRLGARLGLALALGFWSIACALHAFAQGWISLVVFRFLLGIGESFNSPGGMKVIAEWVPDRERGLSTAIFSNGNVAGAIVAPPLIAYLALHFGWRSGFLVPAGLGFVLLALWYKIYRSPAKPVAATPESAGPSMGVRALLCHPLCWGFIVCRALTDPVAYFFNFWLPDYFSHGRAFSLATIGLVGWLPYLAGDIGGPGGGALSDWLVRRGWSPKKARYRLMVGAACVMPLALVAVRTHVDAVAVGLIALLFAGQTCWMANQLSLISEVFPKSVVATVVSISAIGGSLGGIAATLATGRMVQSYGYVPLFTVFGGLHLVAATVLGFSLRTSKP